MGVIIEINQKRQFSLGDAKAVLPLIRRITKRAHEEVKQLSSQIPCVSDRARRDELEQRVRTVYGGWQEKVRKLGGAANGMWLVDFDNGRGYYCWIYPESDIAFFHGYHEGFRGRVRIH